MQGIKTRVWTTVTRSQFLEWGDGDFGMGGDGRLGGLWKMKFEVVGDAGGSGFRWKENP